MFEAAKREQHRSEKFKDHFERIAIAFLWVSAALLVLMGGAWFWHLPSPTKWHYLEVDQVAKLQNLVTGGVFLGAVSSHIENASDKYSN
jgi:hypothetical protein